MTHQVQRIRGVQRAIVDTHLVVIANEGESIDTESFESWGGPIVDDCCAVHGTSAKHKYMYRNKLAFIVIYVEQFGTLP